MSEKNNGFVSAAFKKFYLIGFVLTISFLAFSLSYKNTTQASGAISGTVYIDYNMNGVRNTTGISPNYAVDKGIGGVTIRAYDPAGNLQGTATSNTSGAYTLNATGTGPYRIEFSGLPAGYYSSAVGTNNNSTVQFVPNGNSSNVDLGVVSQKEYCQNLPELVTTCFSGTVNGLSTDPVLISFPFESGTTSTTSSANVDVPGTHNLMVPQNNIGSAWGVAYHQRSKKIFASAFTKRHAGFRNNNKGTASNDPTGEIYISNPTGTTGTLFVNLNTLFGSNIAGNNPHDITDYDTDTTAFDAVGKTALGDIDLSDDERTLYAVNLFNRSLYAIPLGSGTPTAPTTSAQVSVYNLVSLAGASATCPNSADLRPGALKVYKGKLYYGLTCTAQTSGTSADLRAFVYELNPAGSGTATQVANFALNYPRGCVSSQGTTCGDAEWLPWISSQASLLDFVPYDQKYYPQPWLLDIEFDQNNFMIVGLSDRVGHQTGNNRNTADTGQVEGVSAGDTLRMSPSGATWTLENNGSDTANTTAGAGTGDGPGGGEFYFQDGYTITSNVHSEVGLGGLLVVPGYQDIVVSAFDPAPTNTLPSGENTYRAGGLIWLNNITGTRSRSYQLFGIDAVNTFGKVAGIGDTEALCDAAPLQIGNRVWNDADRDGVQGSGEGNFTNVSLQLWADTTGNGAVDTQVGTATTDSNGNYIFGGVNNTNLSTYVCGSTTATANSQVNSSTDDGYEESGGRVRIDRNEIRLGGGNTGGVRFTNLNVPNGATITNAYIQFTADDRVDRNTGTVNTTIRGEASNNAQTYPTTNFGITNRPDTTAGSAVSWNIPNWTTTGQSGAAQRTPDLKAIVQEIVNRPGWASGNAMAFTIAAPAGRRDAESFDEIPANAPRLVVEYSVSTTCQYKINPNTAYEVRIPASNFNSGQPLNNLAPTNPFADTSANGTSRDSNGLVISGSDIVAPVTTGGSGQNNHTIDFGFASGTFFSIGNRVWFDTNDNGIIDGAEVGISGVSVSVLDSVGGVVNTVNTDANGHYRFDNLSAGNYTIRINPSNFAGGGVLERYRDTTSNNTADLDSMGAVTNAENGMNPTIANDVLTNGILSNTITLSSEPTSEPDVPTSGSFAGQGSLDPQADMTVDLGFYQMCLSGTLWLDDGSGGGGADDGLLNGSEPTLALIRVRVFDSGGVEVPVGLDGILGTSDDTLGGVLTDNSGNYNFCGLPQGQYRVAVSGGGTSSTPTALDPDDNVDSDDNGGPGTGSFAGLVVSNLVTLTPGNNGAQSNNTVTNANGTTADPTVDFGFVVAPTFIKLEGFKVFTNGVEVFVEWSTGEEFNNLGFNVYREVNGVRELINSAPIAGSSLRASVNLKATGENYSWQDTNPKAGAVYYLEDIDMNGETTLHGPVYPEMKYFSSRSANPLDKMNSPLLTEMTRVGNPTAQKVFVGSNISAGKSQNKADSVSRDADRFERQQRIASQDGLKFFVRKDGWYRVSAEELVANGFDANSNRANWQLFESGVEVPVQVSADGSIEFYGRGLDIPTSDTRTYYLVKGETSGLRIELVEGGSASDNHQAESFDVTTVRKDRMAYLSLIFNGEKENWFGAFITRNGSTEQELLVENLSANANGQTRLSVQLQGLTAVDHMVSVKFNGTDLGVVSLFNKENQTFEFDLPGTSINEGSNTVSLRSVGTGNDISLVDRISLTYPKRFEAVNDTLHFTAPAGQAVRFGGFATDENVSLFEINAETGRVQRQVTAAEDKSGGVRTFSVGPANFEREFLAIADSEALTVGGIQRNVPSNWNDRSNEAKFVIITPRSLQGYTAKLVEVREAGGLRTEVVAIEDIYDEYSFGVHSPEAIRRFLERAATDWTVRVEYALLLGDSSFDPRNYLGQQDQDLIPTKLLDTEFIETASDSWLADFNDDGVEDIALGRLPATNEAEAKQMMQKTLRYQDQRRNPVRRNTLISDRGFEHYNNLLESKLPTEVETTRIDRVDLTDSQMNQAIIDRLNANPQVVTYTGHGSSGLWAGVNVFTVYDVEELNNEEYSLYLLMTCLNGFTHSPYNESITEKLLQRESGGAALVWASSGTTLPNTQFEMTEIVTEMLYRKSSEGRRIGDILMKAKHATADEDVRRTWQLFGDPTSFIK